ncbi:keratin-associated protein 19-2-like [Cydia splendana]|uniref:keratin-associated protein 19-2-like n=1 Tax=Cydia splendana TaxID=1100963 RepID=UPI0028F48538
MDVLRLTFMCGVLCGVLAAPASKAQVEDNAVPASEVGVDDRTATDLKTAASSTYNHAFSDLGYSGGYGGYAGSGAGVTGYGLLDNYNYQGLGGGYSNSLGYNGYKGYQGYQGYGGYQGAGLGGYNRGYSGYDSSLGGYSGQGGYSGYGGYGGYGGNGGLNSYYGYNSPYNQGAYHLGYGYYNRKPGYGNIYSNGVTPSLVTGYRGYTR